MAESRVIQICGNYRKVKSDPNEIGFKDLENPWTFYGLFSSSDDIVSQWLIRHGLILGSLPCTRTGCSGNMKLSKRTGRPLSCTLRCNKSRDHEVSCLKYSFFERTKMNVRDVMQLTKTYLDGHSLGLVARSTGVSYSGTAVDWASFIRELFKEHYYRHIRHKKMRGIIEIDESLFGRRVKYHRGNPNKGLKIWVFGMVERESNSLILYPVKDRSAKTLVPLIERHVEKGSTVYSDGFSSYFQLNDHGYRHFTVLHKYSFKKIYRNTATDELESVHTNRIEGAWKHAKDYFRIMAGTSASQWEGHMAEIMCRSHFKANMYTNFFSDLCEVYSLTGPPNLTYTTPLFDSWDGFTAESEDTVYPALTDPETTAPESTQSEAEDTSGAIAEYAPIPSDEDLFNISDNRPTSPKFPAPRRQMTNKMSLIVNLLGDSSVSGTDDEAETTICQPTTSTPLPTRPVSSRSKLKLDKTKHIATTGGSDHVCCPKGYRQSKIEGKTASTNTENPYSKKNFMWDQWSSDEDFSEAKPRRKPKSSKK